jgi:broad specificity phosphatase PhoE/predicted kinase
MRAGRNAATMDPDHQHQTRSARMRDMMTRAVSFDNVTAFAASPPTADGPLSSSALLNAFPEPEGGSGSSGSAADGGLLQRRPVGDIPKKSTFATKRLAIVMVGLPARGKTHIARCLERYLNWLGFTSTVWNVGNYRRKILGGSQPAEFFDPHNEDGARARMELALECLNDMLNWFEHGGLVGIYDATNSTVERRKMVKERLEAAAVRVLFLESICTDKAIIQRNILETKMRSPDYRGADPEDAVRDFTARIQNYLSVAETVRDEEKSSYIKIVNVGKQIILNDIQGYVQSKIVSFLLNTHITTRSIYLSRHGESEWNVTGQLGGDPQLTERGRCYAKRLAEFIKLEFVDDAKQLPLVWTSQLRRTRQTVEHIPTMNLCWRALNEIDAGVCEGLTYEEVAKKLPEVAAARKQDKLRYRYPGGESYVDVIFRIEPVILELERQRGPVLIIAHNAVIRSIYAYFTGKSQEECPNLDIPLHTVFKLTPTAYGAVEKRYPIDVASSYRNKTPDSTPQSTDGEESAVAQNANELAHVHVG